MGQFQANKGLAADDGLVVEFVLPPIGEVADPNKREREIGEGVRIRVKISLLPLI